MTGSTRPYHARPSSAALDAAFETHKGLERVRVVHGLYMDVCTALLRASHRLEAIGEYRARSAVEALVVLVEQHAARHIAEVAKRHADDGGQHGG